MSLKLIRTFEPLKSFESFESFESLKSLKSFPLGRAVVQAAPGSAGGARGAH